MDECGGWDTLSKHYKKAMDKYGNRAPVILWDYANLAMVKRLEVSLDNRGLRSMCCASSCSVTTLHMCSRALKAPRRCSESTSALHN